MVTRNGRSSSRIPVAEKREAASSAGSGASVAGTTAPDVRCPNPSAVQHSKSKSLGAKRMGRSRISKRSGFAGQGRYTIVPYEVRAIQVAGHHDQRRSGCTSGTSASGTRIIGKASGTFAVR